MKNYNYLNFRIKTKSLIKGNFIKYLFLLLGVIILTIAPIVHIYFPTKNKIVEEFKGNLKVEINEIKNEIELLKNHSIANNILAKDYFYKYNEIQEKLIQTEKRHKELIHEKTEVNRIFGWKTKRAFLIGFGIRLPFLLFSLIISYLIFKINTKDKTLKKAFRFLEVAIYSISFYVIIWVFWDAQDYPLKYYWYSIFIFCILSSVICLHFINYHKISKSKLINIIHLLFKGYYEDLEKKDLIHPNKAKAYKLYRMRLTDKVVEHE